MAGAAVQARPPEFSPSPLQLRLQQQQQVRRPSMDGQDRSSYGGTGAGAGGKARSAGAVNRRKTPYDRPSQGRHASGGPQAAALLNGQTQGREGRVAWLGSGLVGTASKFLTSGASYLLSSVFRRRPNAPLALTYGADTAAADGEETGDGVTRTSPSKAMDLSDGPGRASPHRQNDMAGTSNELNTLLKKHTLSSEEYARLTQLLQSRVVDNGANKEHEVQDFEIKGAADGAQKQPEFSRPQDAQRWRDQPLTQPMDPRPNGIQNGPVLESSSATPGGTELNNGSDSPVEIARAFMGDRVVRGPGSASPAQGQKVLDGNVLGSPLPLSSRAMVSRVVTNEVSHNTFQTPPATRAFRALPGTSYTPYSRPVHGQAAREVTVEASLDGAAPSRWTPIRVPVTGGPQSLKRRSTVLDDGWASVGPIRRTKRKSLAASTISSTAPFRSFGLLGDSNAGEPTLQKTPFRDADSGSPLYGARMLKEGQIDTRRSAFGPGNVVKVNDRKGDASGLATVPVQSTETARKILEALDRITSSPPGKLLDDELALINSRPQTPLTTSMLNQHAQRSMQDPGYLVTQLTQDAEPARPSGRVFGEVGESTLSTSKGMLMVREAQKSVSTRVTMVSSGTRAEGGQASEVDTLQTTVVVDNAKGLSTKVEPQSESGTVTTKKDGFRMNADTDGSDSDHDVGVNAWGSAASRLPQQAGSGLVPFPRMSSSEFVKSPATESAKGKGIGGFTFPVSNSFGNSTEPPPTPKAMPSPAMNGGTAVDNSSAHVFQFGTGPAQGHSVKFSFSTGPAEEQGQAGSVFGLKKESRESHPILSNQSASANFSIATQAPLQSQRAELKTSGTGSASNVSTEGFPAAGTIGAFPVPSLRQNVPDTPPAASVSMTKTESAPLVPHSTFLGTSGSLVTAPFTFATTTNPAADTEKVNVATQFSASGLTVGMGTSAAFSFGLSQAAQTTFSGTDVAAGLKLPPVSGSRTQPALFSFVASDSTPAVTPSPISALTSTPTTAPTPAPTAATGASQASSAGQPSFTFNTPPASLTSTSSSVTVTTLSGFGSTPSPFGTSSVSSSGFGTSSASSSGFGTSTVSTSGFGTPTVSSSSGFGLGPSNLTSFGSGTTPLFGSNPLTPFPGFNKDASTSQSSVAAGFGSSFGASPASNSLFSVSTSKTDSPFAFSSGSGTSASGGMFQFSSAGTTASTGFPAAIGTLATTGPLSQPTFGLGQPSPAFGANPVNGGMATETGGEHTSMEDMAEEPVQPVAATAPLSIFQQPSGPSPPSTFVFGQPSVAAQPSVFSFSQPQTQPQPNSFQAGVPNPFAQPSGALDFGGGGFSVGSGGSEPRPGRRIIKPRKTGAAKRGK